MPNKFKGGGAMSNKVMTAEARSELYLAVQTKAIRSAIFDVAIFVGILYLADKAPTVWPEYAAGAFAGVVAAWVWFVIERWKNWRDMEFLEKTLGENEPDVYED
jgi:hypothetical protein